ncbi:DUF2975 domain-containing protein [Phytomonospora sp. NPDC050363]|uniref:DUF2975 domain-containing protein n=1 Tax=Phytomonospora sp. NPDC050363 TaxID=3155642 RepID=UPI0033E076BC
MGKLTVLALRVVIVALFCGALFFEAVIVPIMIFDKDPGDPPLAQRVAFIVIFALGLVTAQVILVCVWRLVTMVHRGTVFSPAAFRWVDIVIGAFVFAALLTFGFGVALAPGEEVPPGFVLLVGGVGVGVLGVALIVLVLRMLLAQAIAREAEAARLKSELEEVI